MSDRNPSGLRKLDDRWIPHAARRLRRLRGGPGQPRGVGGALGNSVSAALHAQPALAGSILVVFAAAVLLAALGTGPDGGRNQSKPVLLPSRPPSAIATIGPAPGTSIAAYMTRASVDLRHYGEIAARRDTYAVVDLKRYLTPERALQVVANADVVRAYVRVPSRYPTQPRSVPLTTGGDLNTGMLTAGTVAQATAKSYAALLAALHPRNHAQRLVERRYAVQRRAAVAETTQLSHPATCACVFAFVVRGGVALLGNLAKNPAVRVVDPAPPVVSLTGLTVLPLQPEYRSVVPRLGLPGG